jgi:hypothetical protein
MDPTAILGALSGIKTILDLGKTLEDQKVVSAINSAVADVQVKLILAQQQIIEVLDENRRLKEQLAELQSARNLADAVSFHDGAYWRKREDSKEDGPFCPSCWELNSKLVQPEVSSSDGRMVSLYCTHHKETRYFTVPHHLVEHLNPIVNRGSGVWYSE